MRFDAGQAKDAAASAVAAETELTLLQRQAVEAAEAWPVHIDVETVLGEARAATGLADFGEGDFRTRLALWVRSVQADGELTQLGRAALLHLFVRLATTRLRLVDLAKRRADALEQPLEPPIIIAGLPRSGTTTLLHLLAADTRLRSLPSWEALEPVPAAWDRPTADDPNPRRTRALANWTAHDRLLPAMKAMHGFDPDHASEDIELIAADFSSYMIEWLVHAPLWRDHWLASDHRPAYRWLARALQLLAAMRGPRRWVTKNPQHMESLGAIADVFPDATVVVTHRDPVACVQSAATIICYTARLTRRRVDPREVALYWTDRFRRLLERCVAERDRLPRERSLDLCFDRWIGRQDETLERIYAMAGLPLTHEARVRIDTWRAANPHGQFGRVASDLRRDFGLEPEEVRRQFDFYFERFPVAIEVH